jgi:hypothetical protein
VRETIPIVPSIATNIPLTQSLSGNKEQLKNEQSSTEKLEQKN